MAIEKEWRCAAHGEFTGSEQRCPWGCPTRFVVQEFRTAPAVHDGTTAYTDRTLQGLADSVGLTDMSNRNGSVMNSQRPRQGPDFSPRWIDIPHASPGWSQRQEKSPIVTPEQVGQPGLQAANIVDEFKAQGIHLPGPTLAASKAAGLLMGAARKEDLE